MNPATQISTENGTSPPGAAWLRAQPVVGRGPAPRLYQTGSNQFSTQPDGLYICLAPAPQDAFADAVAIEVCGSSQNFDDQRSRYAPSTVSRGLWCDRRWLRGAMPRGRGRKPRWELAGTFDDEPEDHAWLPVRFLRVLYILQDDLFTAWRHEGIPQGHEFVSRYSSIESYTARQMQCFLRHMMVGAHFYPRSRRA